MERLSAENEKTELEKIKSEKESELLKIKEEKEKRDSTRYRAIYRAVETK